MSDRGEAWVKVYRLASELGVGSHAVIAKLEAMGEPARSADSSVEAPVADKVRAQFSVQPVKAREDTAGWHPLSRRGADAPGQDEILYEDVPPHLSQPLLYWLESLFERAENHGSTAACAERKAGRVAARVRLDLGSASGTASRNSSPLRGERSGIQALMHLAATQGGTIVLDIVDATLADGVDRLEAEELEQLLTDAGSAWHVTAGGKALQRRVSPTVRQALEAISGTAAAVQLSAAWTAAYGRHPDPSLAYSQAIKAVESASIPIVLPRDRLATLGKVIGELDQQQRWQLAISVPGGGSQADITAPLAMLRLLWNGQTDRHGSSRPPVPVTPQAAEASVHLALTLVHWFQSGAISRIRT